MAKRMSGKYSIPKSNSYSSDSSFDNDTGDIVYHDLRQKVPIKIPFRMDNSIIVENVPVLERRVDIRPHSLINCKKCNQIRTNPRFRPSSYHCYNELSKVQSIFHSNDAHDESSEDQVSFYKPSFPKNRRRFRYKNHAR